VGYWQQDDEGHSFVETDDGLVWGDTPADVIGGAIEEVKVAFVKDLGRLPTKREILAGIQFTTAVLDGLPETVEQAEQMGHVVTRDFFEGDPDGYHREPKSEQGKAFLSAYYRATDPASILTGEAESRFRLAQREAWKTLNQVTAALEVPDPANPTEPRLKAVEG
jgi:hypothetical protein